MFRIRSKFWQNYALHLVRQPVAVRLVCFVGLLWLLWVPIAAPIYRFGGDRNWTSILTMSLLYGEFIVLVRWWGRNLYRHPKILRHYGLVVTGSNSRDWLVGLAIGGLSLLVLLVLEGALGWLLWQSPTVVFPRIVLEGLAISFAVGFAEELLFRGWLLDELQRDYRPSVAAGIDAFLFALLHFVKLPEEMLRTFPEFPGLFLLGLILVWAKRIRGGRLGLPMGFHAGLVWCYYTIHVGQLVQYSHEVPNWVTGIGENPLAGIMGMLCLSTIAVGMRLGSIRFGSNP